MKRKFSELEKKQRERERTDMKVRCGIEAHSMGIEPER